MTPIRFRIVAIALLEHEVIVMVMMMMIRITALFNCYVSTTIEIGQNGISQVNEVMVAVFYWSTRRMHIKCGKWIFRNCPLPTNHQEEQMTIFIMSSWQRRFSLISRQAGPRMYSWHSNVFSWLPSSCFFLEWANDGVWNGDEMLSWWLWWWGLWLMVDGGGPSKNRSCGGIRKDDGKCNNLDGNCGRNCKTLDRHKISAS